MKRELNLSIALSYASLIISNLISIPLTPLVVGKIGISDYGLYTLAISTATYFAMEGFGVSKLIIRLVTKLRVEGDDAKRENSLFLALALYMCFGIISAGICLLIRANAPLLFPGAFETASIGTFRSMFLMLTYNTLILSLQNFLFAVITGYERFLFVRWIYLLRIVVKAALTVLLVLIGAGVAELVLLELALTAATTVLFIAYYLIRVQVRIRFRQFDRALVKELAGNMGMMYGVIISSNLGYGAGNLIVAGLLGAGAVSIYNIGLLISGMFTQLTVQISGYFLPGATKLVVSGASNERLLDRIVQSGRYIQIPLVLLILGFAFVGEDLLTLWLGTDFALAYPIALLLMISHLYPCMQYMCEIVNQAQNRNAARTVISAITTAATIGVGYWATSRWALPGAWVGTAVPLLLFKIIGMNIYYHRLGLDMWAFFLRTVPKMLICSAVSCAAVWGLSLFLRTGPLAGILIKGGAVTVIYLASVWFIYMNGEERQSAMSALKQTKNKPPV